MRAPIHPGEVLADELEALEMSAAELARRIRVPTNRITQILRAERSLSADTALRLGRFFGTSARFWFNLQQLHDLDAAMAHLGSELEGITPLEVASASDDPGYDATHNGSMHN